MSTIKEVAQRACVSVTTVSRVLNNRGYISQSMRERIRKAMQELNYHPNEVARSLSFQQTHMIGVLTPEINTFFSEVISSLSRILTERGYKMLLYVANGNDDDAPDYVNMLKSNQVDGMIIALRSRLIDKSLDHQLPVVTFENVFDGGFPTILCDNLEGGRLAAKELLECGAVHPLMIAGKNAVESLPAFDRIKGYRETISATGMKPDVYEFTSDTYHGNFSSIAREVFQQHPNADGIFCTSDTIASYIVQELLARGKRIPEDVRVVGFNDSILARTCSIPLTSIRQPVDEMCSAAVDCLLAQIHGESYTSVVKKPVTIVRRTSTRGDQDI